MYLIDGLPREYFFSLLHACAKSQQEEHQNKTQPLQLVQLFRMTGKKRDVWQPSEYFNELGKKDKTRYKEKPSLSDGTTVTDPYGL